MTQYSWEKANKVKATPSLSVFIAVTQAFFSSLIFTSVSTTEPTDYCLSVHIYFYSYPAVLTKNI